MAYVNKTSLRDEFSHLKGEFATLAAAGKVTPESRVLFNALLMLLEVMMAVFLEKTTPKTSRNSSKPSSQMEAPDTSAVQGTHARGLAAEARGFTNTRTIETVEVAAVETCGNCGEDLRKIRGTSRERRTRIDLVFEKVVTHIDAEIKTCPHCAATTKGDFPADLAGPVQYGIGIKAYVLNLLVSQMVSLSRVQKLLETLIGEVLAEATLLKYVWSLHEALARWERMSIEQLLGSPALHVDETSVRVDRHNHWVHVYASGMITLKFVHPKRGTEAIEAIGIIPRYGGVTIHDCWASYLSYGHCGHGLCGAHLLRELTFIHDANGYPWAANMKRLLRETCAEVSRRESRMLTQEEYANLQKRYRNILTRGARELPPIPERASGKRGRVAKSDAHNLWERLREHETAVLLFARRAEVAFTNNRAERNLRMGKVKQKVSGCFRQQRYAEAYCRISSHLQTMAYQGVNPLVAIQLALSGELYARKG
ncbi:MAG: hypothetical protein CALGDGBN_02341 [Pseudomonadales bacterium]|nr:hypothetical protein [Pseudomonadales bacterium]